MVHYIGPEDLCRLPTRGLRALTLRSGTMRGTLRARRTRKAVAVVALDGDRPVGWSVVTEFDDDILVGVFVAPEYRRRGIGAELARRIRPAKRFFDEDARLVTAPHSRAGRAMYRRAGMSRLSLR